MSKIFKIAEEDLFGKHLVVDKDIQKELKRQKMSEQRKKDWQFIRFFRGLLRLNGMTYVDYKRNRDKLRQLTYYLCYLYDLNSSLYILDMIKLIKKNKSYLSNFYITFGKKVNEIDFKRDYHFINKKGIIK